MKASEALIAWTPPDHTGSPTCGQVKVGPLLADHEACDWSAPYACTGGAAYAFRRELAGWQQIAFVFMDFQSLVFGYGLSPEVVHDALLVIDEYAQRIPPDHRGAKPLSGHSEP